MPIFPSRRAPRALVGAAVCLTTVAACQRRPAQTATNSTNTGMSTVARPVIDSVRPTVVDLTGDAPPDLIIHGRGFDGQRNQVAIGPLILRDVPAASSGRRIVVRVPDRVPSRGEAPPARWTAGRHAVLVTVGGLRSDTAWVEVRP